MISMMTATAPTPRAPDAPQRAGSVATSSALLLVAQIIGNTGLFTSVLLIVLILLLYFDFRREAAILAGTYLAANLAFSGLSLLVGLPAFALAFSFSITCSGACTTTVPMVS